MQLHQQIEQWLNDIGNLIKQRITEGLDVSVKTSLSDLVTNVDKEVEENFCQFITEHFPGHVVLGEEGCHECDYHQKEHVWVIDPIDGTLNFVKEQKNFAVMVAYYQNGVGQLGFIYDVVANNCYMAIKGKGVFKNNVTLTKVDDLPLNQSIISISSNLFFLPHIKAKETLKDAMSLRMVGSAGQSMLSVINGYFNGYFSVQLQPWDYLPGIIFADELGIVYSTLDNEPIELFKPTTMLFATPKVHHHIIQSLIEK